jgi:hypothetical protein
VTTNTNDGTKGGKAERRSFNNEGLPECLLLHGGDTVRGEECQRNVAVLWAEEQRAGVQFLCVRFPQVGICCVLASGEGRSLSAATQWVRQKAGALWPNDVHQVPSQCDRMDGHVFLQGSDRMDSVGIIGGEGGTEEMEFNTRSKDVSMQTNESRMILSDIQATLLLSNDVKT